MYMIAYIFYILLNLRTNILFISLAQQLYDVMNDIINTNTGYIIFIFLHIMITSYIRAFVYLNHIFNILYYEL